MLGTRSTRDERGHIAGFLTSALLSFGVDKSLEGGVLCIVVYLVASLDPPDASSTLSVTTTKNDIAK